ncbi:ATP-binding protein [Olivibacter sp. 47]|uniref:AlbA family DNA-binding domain-containing protein n=1 Tax=Olivibacter sp. 47 TaxID=3056486 RepID=UPI0025A48AE3|nr:ATP-binding protein [Olivibacter sp. 47]MDM8177779.1 ATP-binding protein [Olivibacter sp. 47]
MTKTELIKKLSDIEWEDFEVKESKSELPKNIWETVSAFSNTAGGWIVLGVKQKGKTYEIVGVGSPDKIEQDFTNTLRGEKFNAKLLPLCKKYQFDEKVVLAFFIPVSSKKPIYYNNPANTFLRTASGDQRASKEEIDAMYRDQAFGTRSSESAKEFTLADLDMTSVKEFRSCLSRIDPTHPYNKLSDDIFLQKVRITDNGNLTYSGLFFLGSNDAIQKAVPDFRID